MLIIGVDYHPSDQYIAFADTETGECGERRLNHSDGDAEKFYRSLQSRAASGRVGMEATGYSRWFERLLAELGIEFWIGDAAEIKTRRVRKQKTDTNDARLLLKLLLEDNFPRIWVPDPENRDLRQLLWHRHRMVQMRTRIMNQLQAVASQVQSASENGSIFFLSAGLPSAEVVANVAAGARATAGGAVAEVAEMEFADDDEDDSVAAAGPFVALAGAEATAVAVSFARDFFNSASSSSIRFRIASSSASIAAET